MLFGCAKDATVPTQGTNNVAPISSNDNTQDEIPASEEAKKEEIDVTSFEFFVNSFKDTWKDGDYTDANTKLCLDTFESNFPYLYNHREKLPGEPEDWTFHLISVFSYFYKFLDTNTNGYYFGETGLKCLHDLYFGKLDEYDKDIKELMDIAKVIGVKCETKILNNVLQEGQYKVGLDCEPGEYALFTSGSMSGYFSVTEDPNGDKILFNDNFDYNSFITINDGEYLKLSRSYAVPLSNNEVEVDTSSEGMFRVGIDIEPGEYKLVADEGSGYYCIYPDSRHSKIVTNDMFEGQAYINVVAGQYLKLNRCKIEGK